VSNERQRSGFWADLSKPEQTRFSPFAAMPKEIRVIIEQIGDVEYPVTSKADFLKKLGGEQKTVKVGDRDVGAATVIMMIPAQVFPLASVENLAEKLSEIYFQRVPSPGRMRAKSADEFLGMVDRFVCENHELVEKALAAFYKFRP
jgi:hypothetical protein